MRKMLEGTELKQVASTARIVVEVVDEPQQIN